MLCSQIVLFCFISEWIRVQYREQERRLNEDLKQIFVMTERRISDSLLDQTVSMILKTPNGNVVQDSKVVISGSSDASFKVIKDSIVRKFPLSGNVKSSSVVMVHPSASSGRLEQLVIEDFSRDSVINQDIKKVLRIALMQTASKQGLPHSTWATSVDNKLLAKEYIKALEKNNYTFQLKEDSISGIREKPFAYKQNSSEANPIAIIGYGSYLFATIFPQLIFSVCLLLLTSLAFWLAYSNMKQQTIFSKQKDSMISNISHELKTPVATTKVALEALSSFQGIDDPVRTKKYLQVAEWEIKRLEDMIERVMAIMQTDAKNMVLHKEVISLAQLMIDMTNTLLPIISEKNIRLITTFVDKQVLVSADKTHLTGALYNVIDNAIKYGGNLMEIKLEVIADNIVLQVKDNGPGIPASFHKKVFEHFFRMPSGNKHNVKGHGLGLSYAQQIIVLHEGSIRLESKPSHGTTFIITLPQTKVA